MLVTMVTPIPSHVKDNNSIFTLCDEDMIFFKKKEKTWSLISIYEITTFFAFFPLDLCKNTLRINILELCLPSQLKEFCHLSNTNSIGRVQVCN